MSEMLQATTEFRKNGFNDEDAAQLGQIASMYQNVSDEMVSAGDSASFIIAQLVAFGDEMVGFNTEAEKATHIIDAVNEVANNFSVSSADLANNLGNMSAVMSQTGASFEESLAMLTAITEVTRSASKASRGLVSIGSRLNQIVDESSSTGKALKEIYEELGITLFDQEGQLRSSYDIFTDLAAIWNTLDKNTQNYIASQQAGTNQFQNFAALMQNFSTATEATSVALNSAGSAARENSRYMEGLEAKTQAVKASFEALSNTVIDSGLVKSILDLAKGFLDLSNNGIGAFLIQSGLLTGVLWGGTGLIKAMKLLPNIVAGLTGTMTSFTGVLSLTTPQIALISAGIVALVTIVNSFRSAWMEAHPTLEMIEEDLNDLNAELDTNKSRLQELESIPWADRTTAQKVETEEIRAQNAELEKNIQLKNQQKALTWTDQTVTTGIEISNVYGMDQFKEFEGVLYDTAEAAYAVIDSNEYLQDSFAAGLITVGEAKENVVDYIITSTQELEEYNRKIELTGNLTADEKARQEELTYALVDYLEQLNEMNDGTALEAAGLDEVRNALESVLAPAIENIKQLKAISEGFELNSNQIDKLVAKYPDLKNNITQVGDALYIERAALIDLASATEDLNTVIIDSQTGAALATKTAVTERLNYLRLEISAVKNSAMEFSDYYWQLVNAEQGIVDALAHLAIDRKDLDVESEISTSIEKEKTLIDLLKEELEILDHQAFLAEKNGEEQLNLVSIYEQAQKKIHDIAEKYRQQGYAETSAEIRELQKLWWDYADEIDNVYQDIADAQQEAIEEAKQAWEEAQQALIDDLNDKKSDYETAFNYMAEQIQKEIDALQEQRDAEEKYWDAKIEALEEQNEEIERQIELEQLQEQLARARQSKVLVYKDGKFQYVQNVEEISEAEKNLEAYEREEALRQETENLEQLKDQALAAIDEQIKGWEKYKEEWSSVVDSYQEEQDRLIAEQILGIELEGENWQTRLDNLQSYVNEYLSIIAQLNQAQEELNAGFQMGTIEGGELGEGLYFGSSGGSTAWIPGTGTVPVQIENGHTVTSGLPTGTIVYPSGGGAWEITGVNPDGSYQSRPVGGGSSGGGGSSSSSSSSGKYTGTSTSGGGSYNIGSDKGKDFVSNAKPGSTMTGGDGSTWTKNEDGSTTISKGDSTWVVGAKAKGTLYNTDVGLNLVGENGPELRVLGQGDGIIPANATKNLMEMSKYSIKDLLANQGQNVYSYVFDKLVLPNVTDAQSFINELKRFKQYAYQH